MAPPNSSFYQIGASLPVDAPSYVKRSSDEEFYQKLQAGKLSYVLNSRQMGKSSLRVQTMQRLKASSTACGVIDLTGIGRKVTLEQWYGGIVYALVESFHLEDEFDFDWQTWWPQKQKFLGSVTSLRIFITEILLEKIKQPIVIFIDEIDSVLSQDFSTDGFFALIRSFQNQRADNPNFKRLTFALLGVATPSDLIRDKKQTPFNIGEAIELHGFKLEEVEPLVKGLEDKFRNAQALLEEVLYWTSGQPFLTQKVCQLIRNTEAEISNGNAKQWVENLLQKHLLENWEAQDEPEHLRTIRDRLLSNKQRAGLLLGLYQNILQSQQVQPNNSIEETELRLSGLIVKEQSQLRVYNRVYSSVFDLIWVKEELAKLRPYNESLNAWLASKRQDYSRLLQGKALQEALQWAEGKSLSDDDNQFLRASQRFDIEEAKKANSAALKGLIGEFSNLDTIIQEVLSWTGGQPILSEKLGQLIATDKSSILEGNEHLGIEQLVRTRIIENWETQETAEFFIGIRSRLLRDKKLVVNILQIYQQILQQGAIAEDDSTEQMELLQSGLVIKQQNQLRIYNRIYTSIFDLTWVNQMLENWRPFAVQFETWAETKDESQLLNGQPLQNALIWALGKELTIEEHEFLIISQVLETLALASIFPNESKKIDLIAATTKLAKNANKPQAVIQEIFSWTRGHPGLTINLCNLICNSNIKEVEEVKQLIKTHIIADWDNQEALEDVRHIWNYLLIEQPHSFWTLEVYKQTLQQEVIAANDSLEQLELLKLGLVTKAQDKLTVANPIYESIFNQQWVEKWLNILWPHAQAVIAWFASNCEDESQLLHGEILQKTLVFVQGRNLSAQEHKYFMASLVLDIRKIRLALEEAENEAIQTLQKCSEVSNFQDLFTDIQSKHTQTWQTIGNWSQTIKDIKEREQELGQQQRELIKSLLIKDKKQEKQKQIFADFIQNFPKTGLPVTIVTGFLGSGKSTFINKILENTCPKGAKVAVLVYEFGDINIDSELIDIDSYLIEISSSYPINDNDLVDKVYHVLEREEEIDYLIIEATGVADPLPIVLTFLGTELRDLTRLDSIITFVDAANDSLDLLNSEAALKQITYGDIILLNKTDLVNEAELQKLEEKILEVKEHAKIIRSNYCQVPLSLILNAGFFESDKYFDVASEHGYNYGDYHHDSDYLNNDGLTSVFFQSEKPFDVNKFENFLNEHIPKNVFRAKGILWFSGIEKRHIFYLSGNRYNLDPDEWKDKPKNQLLLISQNLDRETLLEQLELVTN